MYAPHTITIYNLTENEDTLVKEYNITTLMGVFVEESNAVSAQRSGLAGSDAVTVYIPFSVDAQGKTYLPEKRYEESAEKQKHWTMRSGADFFIRGEVSVPGAHYEQINSKYDNVFHITAVDVKDFGSDTMRHWQIGGK